MKYMFHVIGCVWVINEFEINGSLWKVKVDDFWFKVEGRKIEKITVGGGS